MKTKKLLLITLMVVFALAFVQAASVTTSLFYGSTTSDSLTIDDGEQFNVIISADSIFEDSMEITLELLDSNGNVIAEILSVETTSDSYFNDFDIGSSIYGGAGDFTIRSTVIAVGGDTSTDELYLTVNPVIPVNNAPVITSTPVTEVNESDLYSYDVDATDADGDTLTYRIERITGPLGSNITWLRNDHIDSSTGLISTTAPSVGSDTDYSVNVSVSDGTNTIYQEYTLTINDIPSIPTNSIPVANDVSVATSEGIALNITLDATDADGDTLTYTVSGTSSNGTLSNFDSATGTLTYTPNAGFYGTDSFEYFASDGSDDSNIATVTIAVNANTAPTISTTPVTEINESENYVYDVDATDVDGDTITYNLTQAPNWMSINPSTGLINVTAPVVTNDTNYSITVSVTDGVANTTQSYTLTVFNVPVPNNAPIITSTPGTSVDEDARYQYQVTATDADGDSLTYLLTEAPGWLAINSTTGLLEGVAPIVNGDVRTNITVMVSDGNDVAIQRYVLTIDNIRSQNDDDDDDDDRRERITGGTGGYEGSVGSSDDQGPIVLGENYKESKTSLFSTWIILLLIAILILAILIIIFSLIREDK